MSGVRNFKTKAGYRKWLAYGHLRTKTGLSVSAKAGRKNVFDSTPGYSKIAIGGKAHRVMH